VSPIVTPRTVQNALTSSRNTGNRPETGLTYKSRSTENCSQIRMYQKHWVAHINNFIQSNTHTRMTILLS
jgi:hypothetical protein